MRCDVCGAEKADPASLVSEKLPFCSRRLYCQTCYSKHETRILKWIFTLQFLAGPWGLLLLMISNGTKGYVAFNLFCVQIFMALSLLPHELGHALAARMLRLKGIRIMIGYGGTLFSRRMFGFDWHFGVVPMGGMVLLDNIPLSRLKHLIVVLAGPVANLGLVAVALSWISEGQLWSFYLFENQLIPAQMLFIANILILIENFLPYDLVTPVGKWPSDGKQLLQLLRPRKEIISEGTKTGNTVVS